MGLGRKTGVETPLFEDTAELVGLKCRIFIRAHLTPSSFNSIQINRGQEHLALKVRPDLRDFGRMIHPFFDRLKESRQKTETAKTSCPPVPGFRVIYSAGCNHHVCHVGNSISDGASHLGMQAQIAPIQHQSEMPEWSLALRIGFRFCLVYLGLFCLATQVITSLFSATQGSDIPDPATLGALRPIVFWTAGHIFHVNAPLSLGGNSGSGDCMFGWVLALHEVEIPRQVSGLPGNAVWQKRISFESIFRSHLTGSLNLLCRLKRHALEPALCLPIPSSFPDMPGSPALIAPSLNPD